MSTITTEYVDEWAMVDDCIDRLNFLDELAEMTDGRCFIRLAILCGPFALLSLEDFKERVLDVMHAAGKYPECASVLTDLGFWTATLDDTITLMSLPVVYDKMMASKARFKVELNEDRDLAHIGPFSGNRPFCECDTPICEHGWSARMLIVALGQEHKKVRVGASNFNMDEFLSGGLVGEVDEFEEAYSKLSVESMSEDKEKQVKSWGRSVKGSGKGLDLDELRETARAHVLNMDKKHGTNVSKTIPKMQTPGPPPPPPLPKPSKIAPLRSPGNLFNEKEKALPIPKAWVQPSSPESTWGSGVGTPETSEDDDDDSTYKAFVAKAMSGTGPRTLGPLDSSSVVERYGKDYMPNGTVFTAVPANTAADALERRTILAAESHLVEGFTQGRSEVKRESKAIQRITPVNGLPRPFAHKRLNFLANLTTALGRLDKRMSELPVHKQLFSALKDPGTVPCDMLLHQVVKSIIDRPTMTFASNAFRLPYIEIGMIVSEDSIAKMVSLVQSEYKLLWFQEMKSIIVPNFHSQFKGFKQEAMSSSRRDSERDKPKQQRRGSRTSSIFGLSR